jgi:kynurenine formamidase
MAEQTGAAVFTEVVDLTHLAGEQIPSFGDTEKLTIRALASYEQHGYFAREITLPEHFGTHIDAPAHLKPDGWRVDEIPAERLVRPLAVVDVTAEAISDPDYRVSVRDLTRWEEKQGPIATGAVLLAHTGWDQRWHSARAYRNPDLHGQMHFPGFSLEAAKFLLENRKVAGLGIDTLSADAGTAKGLPVHHCCLEQNVYLLENVANLGSAPAKGALLIVAPIKLARGSGAPVRLLALIP